MLIESFLTKIAVSVFQQALINAELPVISKAVEIYSTFRNAVGLVNQIRSINSSGTLRVSGLEVLSDKLANTTADFLIKLGKETFAVDKTGSGIYIASDIKPTFRASPELYALYDQIQFKPQSNTVSFKPQSNNVSFKPK